MREYTELDLMSYDAAQHIKQYIEAVLAQKESFSLILSGGFLLHSLYRALFYIDTLPWNKIHFFISDEKCISHEDFDSNFKYAVKNLLRRSNIPLQNIHWINTDVVPLTKSVHEYEKTLKHYLFKHGNEFDLLLLSVGPDGHIASLFPGFTDLMEKKHLVTLTEKALIDPRVQRITMTLPALNKSRKVLFFLSDSDCRPMLHEILHRRSEDTFSYPAEQVQGLEKNQIWFILRS